MSLHESVSCPHCQKTFVLSEAISKDFEALLKGQIEREYKAKEASLLRKVLNSENEIAEISKKAEAEKYAQKKSFELEKAEISNRLEMEKSELSKKLELEKILLKEKIEADAHRKAEDKYSVECRDLKNAVDEQNRKLKESQGNELKLRIRQRELEQKEKQFEIEMQRKLLDHEKVVAESVRKEIDDEISLKLAAKDQVVENLKKEMASMQRKLEQGSQQLQGEVLEIQIEDFIRDRFPEDEVIEVKKGAKGADIHHKVAMPSGRIAGVIFVECKDVKEWSHQWPIKLKSDMRDKSADLGVIITTALPKDVKGSAFIEGVWVCSQAHFPILVTLLREQLIRVKAAEMRAEVPSEHKDFLFQYMTSNKFVHKVQGVCEMADSMKMTLDSERRSIQKNWKKRETEIDQICLYMSEMYGELQGVVGKALPRVEALELEAPESVE